MKKALILFTIIMSIHSAKAETYVVYKSQVRNELVKCLKDPENSKFSAAYNGCLLDAAHNFAVKASLEFSKAYKKANEYTKASLVKDRQIYAKMIKNCESFQDLSYDGFTTEALCKIQTNKDYLSLLTNGASSYPKSWTIENRIDKLFIGY